MKLLHIDSSPLGDASVSRQLSRDIVAGWVQRHARTQVIYRDLAATPPNHWSAAVFAANQAAPEQLGELERLERLTTDTLLSEFLSADVVVIGAPMYNFGIPTQLKAWIDRVMVAGRTFRYTPEGPVGLAGDRKVIVASTRGGMYSTSEQGRLMDFQEDYLRTVMRFMGINDFQVVRAEGVNMGPDNRQQAIQSAGEQIRSLVSTPLAVAA